MQDGSGEKKLEKNMHVHNLIIRTKSFIFWGGEYTSMNKMVSCTLFAQFQKKSKKANEIMSKNSRSNMQ